MSAAVVEAGAPWPDDSRTLVVRPIRPDDAERLRRMFDRLSPTTVYRRFFTPVPRPRAWVLRHLATVDHHDREAVVALCGDEIVAVARYDRLRDDPTRAEFAITVEDAWQRRGLARALVGRLARLAAGRGVAALTATVLAENEPALRMVRSLSPDARLEGTGPERSAVIPLRAPSRPVGPAPATSGAAPATRGRPALRPA